MRKTVFLLSYIFSLQLQAQDYSKPLENGEVAVERVQDLSVNYKQRRKDFGIIFSTEYEKFYPEEYYSIIQTKTYKEISDDKGLDFLSLTLGVKYNFALGSFTMGLGYGIGRASSPKANLVLAEMKAIKAFCNYTMDNLFDEPIVAPYAQVGLHQFDWLEESKDGSGNQSKETNTSSWTLDYRAGFLFQLNWLEDSIDKNTHVDGLISSGLQNTFIDIFYSVYEKPEKISNIAGVDGEPNLKSENFGVGLKLEF